MEVLKYLFSGKVPYTFVISLFFLNRLTSVRWCFRIHRLNLKSSLQIEYIHSFLSNTFKQFGML